MGALKKEVNGCLRRWKKTFQKSHLSILSGLIGAHVGFPHSSVGKESTCNAGDPSSIPGLGRSPGKGKGYPLQYSGLGHKELDTTERLSLSFFLLHV